MNLIILKQDQFVTPNIANLDERQSDHVLNVLKSKIGDQLKVGIFNGQIGLGQIIQKANDSLKPKIQLQIKLTDEPPRASELEVILALPRPKVIKRMIENLTSLGVKKITFINSARVEKFYWGSDLIKPESWQNAVTKGLEQAKDTVLPEIKFERLFKPYIEDQVSVNCNADQIIFAHPYSESFSNSTAKVSKVLIGPEGGWVDFEVELFKNLGFSGYSFGQRPLKTETFIPFVLGKIL